MKLIILLVLLMAKTTFAQFSFSDSKYIAIEYSNLNGKFGYSKASQFELVNKVCNTSVDCFEFEESTTLIGYWKVDDKTKVGFYYTEGASDDPMFMAVCNDVIILKEAGSTLHFKGKTLYVEGDANAYFDKKRKFQFVDNSYKEVKQPFYYIGLRGKLNYSIKLYKTDKFVETVAQLPKNYDIEVLMGITGGEFNELEKVLIKTEFGLIGWFNFKAVAYEKPLIDALHFHGD